MARRPDLETFAQRARPQDRHDRRPDPLSAREGAHGRAHRRAVPSRRNTARSACICYEDHVNRTVHVALVRGELRRQDACRSCACICRTRLATSIGMRDRALGWPLRSGDAAHRAGRQWRRRHPAPGRERRASSMDAVADSGQRPTAPYAAARRAGAAHLRHRRADPARPRRAPHARAIGAEADARPVGLRPRSGRIRERR